MDVLDGAFVVVDTNGVRMHLPIGGLACVMLEPGARISHGCGYPGRKSRNIDCMGRRSRGETVLRRSARRRLFRQATLAGQFGFMNEDARLKIARKMFAIRFGEFAPERRSVDQLRGIEGARVKRLYELLAQKNGVVWRGRNYDRTDSGNW